MTNSLKKVIKMNKTRKRRRRKLINNYLNNNNNNRNEDNPNPELIIKIIHQIFKDKVKVKDQDNR